MQQSQLGTLKKNIKTQQAETAKAKSELKASLEAIGKLKADFSPWESQGGDWEGCMGEKGKRRRGCT